MKTGGEYNKNTDGRFGFLGGYAMKKRILLVASMVLATVFLFGQLPKIKIKVPKHLPGLDDILGGKPALTTNINDAVSEVPFLDGYDPLPARPLTSLPRTTTGGFVLAKSGDFLFECLSYCLKVGTYAPGESPRGGRGYLYAPFRGPRAQVVQAILQNSYRHPEIPQRDVQVLLWAVIAKTRIQDMPQRMQLVAAKLLATAEIGEIGGGVADIVSDSLRRKALASLPPAVRRIMEAEDKLREILRRGETTYEELERVAVLHGEVPATENDRQVPRGRWSLHPDGYFIRYFPRGYERMLIELNLPRKFVLERDGSGRFASISDRMGYRLEIEYASGEEASTISVEPDLKIHRLRCLHFFYPDPQKPFDLLRHDLAGSAWLFSGTLKGAKLPAVLSSSWDGISERCATALTRQKEMENLARGVVALQGEHASKEIPRPAAVVVDLGHLADALAACGAGNGASERFGPAEISPLDLIREVWMGKVAFGLCKRENAEPIIYDPADDPVPAGWDQNLGDSGVASDKTEKCNDALDACFEDAKARLEEQAKFCLKETGFDENMCKPDALALCMLEIYNGERGTETLNECIIDACVGGPPDLVECLRLRMANYFNRIWKCDREYKACMGN